MRCQSSLRTVGLLALTWLASTACHDQSATAQVIQQTIGGVAIDAHGVVEASPAAIQKTAAQFVRERLADVPDDLRGATRLRMISLRHLEEEAQRALAAGQPVPDEVKYLAGLQRVEFVFLWPDQNTIVLGGPAEGWRVHSTGDIVGEMTGRPVLLLDDLLVALRSVEAARLTGISCSIDPTPEGRQNLEKFLSRQKEFHKGVTRGVEAALGQQVITITGVPLDSHFARVLVASDFRMKRFAMHLEPAPVTGMPSFLELLRQQRGGLNDLMPRWWLASDYQALGRTQDRLAWQIRGQAVKALTEDELVSQNGTVRGTGQANPVAKEWADNLTAHFPELAKTDIAFGQLRNVMDLCVVAALIDKEDLRSLANCPLTLLYDPQGPLQPDRWNAPKRVSTHSSFMKIGRQFVITASGGVQIDPWSVVARTEPAPKLPSIRSQAAPPASTWRW
jgi:hypothetical protein